MEIRFKDLTFNVSDEGVVSLAELYGYQQDLADGSLPSCGFPEHDVAGGNRTGSYIKRSSDETKALRYVSHCIDGNILTLVQKTDRFEVTSVFEGYNNTNAVRVYQNYKNISGKLQTLTLANTFGFLFGKNVVNEHKDWYFHRFTNARYTESMPDVRSLYDLGFYWNNGYYNMSNVGNASAIHNVPQGILENRKTSDIFMFQIESYSSWQVEISVSNGCFNLQLGGPNEWYHAWTKVLEDGAVYTTVPVAICYSNSVNGVLAQMTRYRRHLKPECDAEKDIPTIYNEYMHYSWDSPFASRTLGTAPYVAKTGCEYYVIDCGWHNSSDCDGEIYKHFGTWYEDRGRFPEGIKAVADELHKQGLKFGLWIAPEVVGCKNEKMLAYYGKDCFVQKNGEKVFHGTGYLLDYSHPKVRDYMTKTIDRMVNDYGCDYIKFDGCPNPGPAGEALENYINAFVDWSYEMTQRHPNVIFEDCFGGGMRTDYKALSIFHLISTSDQINYTHYPYIVGNIFCSVLPEQAAVWSYPVDSQLLVRDDDAATNANITKERVVVNMINSLLGRIHLASRLDALSEDKLALITEGIALYHKIVPEKLESVPYLPKGYSMFGDTFVAAGIKTDKKVYLAVWNLNGDRHIKLHLPEIEPKCVSVAYPLSMGTKFSYDNSTLAIDFTEDVQARLFEITL